MFKKSILYFILTTLLFTVCEISAQTMQDVLLKSSYPITWLGIDFTHAKLAGEFNHFMQAGDNSVSEIKEVYIPAWNKIILNENKKYDIKGALRKDRIVYDIDMIMKKNTEIELAEIESYNSPNYSKEDIEQFVNEYSLENKEGVGLVFVVEAFNKMQEEAVVDVVFVDLKSKKILFQEKVIGKPMGFGLRNYWAGAIYHIIREIKETKYSYWKSMYK